MIEYIVLFPLLGALITGLLVRVIGDKSAQLITCGFMLAAAVLAGFEFNAVAIEGDAYKQSLFTWINSGDFRANWVLKVDSLTAVMLVVVTIPTSRASCAISRCLHFSC
jgi:NADH-quinone oxidoreductase subunit L